MKIILLSFILSASMLMSCDKKQKGTDLCVAAFKKLYPGTTITECNNENSVWKVRFIRAGQTGTVSLDANYQVIETEVVYKKSDLPNHKAITEYLKANHPNKKIELCEQVTKYGSRIRYEVQTDDRKLVFDNVGNFITEELD